MTKPTKWLQFDAMRTEAWKSAERASTIFYPEFGNRNACWPPTMPGVIGYLGTKFDVAAVSSNGLTIAGELVVLRTDLHPIYGNVTKAYAFMIGTSSDGGLHYNGPHKDPDTHYRCGRSTSEPQDFLGHTPVGKMQKG